ncbi:MAG: nuclease [Xanthobacteraceae bacterium]|nr:MAG: nuclease [Xanthobacteraceae bacterium]
MFLEPARSPRWRSTRVTLLPWVFVLGVAAGGSWTMPRRTAPAEHQADRHSEIPARDWAQLSHPASRHGATVLRTLDGDTFEARVHVWPGIEITTRVRLRGIDAPELKAACAQELRQAEAATAALEKLLAEGDIAIFNIGPDKYAGRIVADAATRKTANISKAMLEMGLARSYSGGRREGWCMPGTAR